MKTGFRWNLSISFMLIAGFSGLGQNSAAGSPLTSSTITIHAENYAGIDHKTLMEAEEAATRIFRKAGIDIRWVDADPASEHRSNNPIEQRAFNLSQIQLQILSPAMAERLDMPNNAMGLAPGKERDRQLVFVFYEKVESLARNQRRAGADGRIRWCGNTGQILGHVIAHEIGHVLLNLETHSETGIMRGNWNIKNLQDACSGYLNFTAPQAEIIRAETDRRAGSKL